MIRRRIFGAVLASLASAAFGESAVGHALDRPALPVKVPERAVLMAAAQAGSAWIVVGERGIVLRSEDGGSHWRQIASPVSVTLTAVRFADDRHGFAVGHGGTVLVTEDGGRRWIRRLDGRQLADVLLTQAQARQDAVSIKAAQQLQTDGADKPLLDVLVYGPGRALVVGAYGLALATEDSGQTWTSRSDRFDNPKGLHLYAVRKRGKRIAVAGEQGLAFASDDDGQTFRRLTLPYQGSFFTLELPSEHEIVLAGLRGQVWQSPDDGHTWQALALPMPVSVVASQLTSDGTLLLANQAGYVLARRGGVLVPLQPNPLPPLTGLAVGSDGHLLALSVQGVMPISFKP